MSDTLTKAVGEKISELHRKIDHSIKTGSVDHLYEMIGEVAEDLRRQGETDMASFVDSLSNELINIKNQMVVLWAKKTAQGN